MRQKKILALLSACVFAVVPALSNAQPMRLEPDTEAPGSFMQLIQARTGNRKACKSSAACLCSMDDEAISFRLLTEYGSMFAAAETVTLPKRCIFKDDKEVAEFQRGLRSQPAVLGGVTIELQEKAIAAILAAKQEAAGRGLKITPLDGAIAGKRSHADTVRIWNSRFLKALDHWVRLKRISAEDADMARGAKVIEQTRKVIEWERNGLNFGTNVSGSIFASTAPPGTSQHLSMLAFDIVQHSNSLVRKIMNDHGWFQTVAHDPPHFTYLGVTEADLPSRGLKAKWAGRQKYWVPDIQVPSQPAPH